MNVGCCCHAMVFLQKKFLAAAQCRHSDCLPLIGQYCWRDLSPHVIATADSAECRAHPDSDGGTSETVVTPMDAVQALRRVTHVGFESRAHLSAFLPALLGAGCHHGATPVVQAENTVSTVRLETTTSTRSRGSHCASQFAAPFGARTSRLWPPDALACSRKDMHYKSLIKSVP